MEQLTRLPQLPSVNSIRNMPPLARREFRNGMLFISPWLLGFLVFTLIPMVATFLFTFMDLKIEDQILAAPKWVGFDNYITLFQDGTVWGTAGSDTPGAMIVTLKFGLMSLPVAVFLPLLIALLMNNKNLKGQNFFRSMFYMPYIIPFVASVILWGGVLNPENGWVNKFLMWAGMAKSAVPLWVNDVNWVYPTFIIMGIWGIGNAMLTQLAGLQSVPTELYDASKVDGAGVWTTFWNVTFPMISPVVFYNLILSVVGLFQYFLVPLVVNQGTGFPGGATMFYNLLLYRTFFFYHNMSYGATLAWVLFLVILVVTFFLFATARKWVYYASEK
jgi:ABC-type sugar transport system permease subunit